MIEQKRKDILKNLLKDYDFGFDVGLINSDSWEQTGDEYTVQVYLEFINSSHSSPHKGVVTVNFTKDSDTIISVKHQILN